MAFYFALFNVTSVNMKHRLQTMDYEELKSTHKSKCNRSIVRDFDPIYENKINQEKAIVLAFVNGSISANKRREVVQKPRHQASVDPVKSTKPQPQSEQQFRRQIESTNEKSTSAVRKVPKKALSRVLSSLWRWDLFKKNHVDRTTPQQALTEKLHKKIPNSKNVVVSCTTKSKDKEHQYAEKMITYEAVLVQQSKKSNTHQVNRKANRNTSRLQHCCGGRINYAFDFSSELHTTEKLCVC
ncbi:hypothetical protein T4E_2697 [Trichinella pseudospiralis]|uniref:Uncharacterized protein n=2 Tax=Trichinella pseudospiralis TaxID=6337 RepID=A0A0V0XNC1_TRIPS|nr:hypothetical protein T4E_2697 [Trichinella pseudospiralis]